MIGTTPSSYIDVLRDRIDITRVPFSDRGSRLMIFCDPNHSRLHIKLAERLSKIHLNMEGYRTRQPFVRDLALIDKTGQELEFEITTQPDLVILKTRLGEFRLAFQDRRTVVVGLPSNVEAGLRFHVQPQFWKVTERGGVFQAIRNLFYASNTEAKKNEIVPSGGGYTVEFVVQAQDDSSIVIAIGDNLTSLDEVLPFSIVHAQARARWHDWFSRVPPVSEQYLPTYAYAWWIMANNLISPLGSVGYEAMIPSKITYVGLWLWDNAMHALAYRHVDPDLARNQIRAMLAHQQPNGMLPDAIHDEGVITTIDHPFHGEVTKPPILAWAALKLHEMSPDFNFLQEIYVPLVRLNAWWFNMNDDNLNGLAQYNHPYSSGLDDSPLWDHGMPVESPDLNTYLCVQMGSLAVMAEALGMNAEAAMWRRRTSAIVHHMVEEFWDEQAGLFWALHDGQKIPVVTPFNLYPLWTGQLPPRIQQRLIAHLTNPDEFWGDIVLPTVARNDPAYNPEVMWRGPVWVNINYFMIEALHQVGEHALASELRHKTLALVMGQPGIFEYYNAETGCPPGTAAETFGWTAAVFIDLAVQASQEEALRVNSD